MTPQERELVAELFDRLARLEGAPRDPDAIAIINDGLERAPNALYALVQTVLVQDEALKRANARIRELEQQLGIEPQAAEPRERGFLDTMRDTLFGERGDRDQPRTSVPSAGRPMGVPPGFPTEAQQGQQGYPQQGYPQQGYPQQDDPRQAQQQGRGGSFLGTAAAAAAGVIGGSLLLDGIRSAWGQSPGGQKNTAFDSDAGGGRTPWGGEGSGGDLGRQAGLEDVGRGGQGGRDAGSEQGYGLLDNAGDEGVAEEYDADLDLGSDDGDVI